MRKTNHVRSLAGLAAMLAMALYAAPRLPLNQGWGLPALFGLAWLAMALLVISAYLHRLLGVDEETREALEQIRRVKRLEGERRLRGKPRLFAKK